jgi:large subunit ribosomal protein L1
MFVSNRKKIIYSLFKENKSYNLLEAFRLIKKFPRLDFKNSESIDVSVKLGVDSRKSDQVIKGYSDMPFSVGKKVNVCIFAKGTDRDICLSKGFENVGSDDLVSSLLKNGLSGFNLFLSTEEMLSSLKGLKKLLGSRGYFPSTVMGTVSDINFLLEKGIYNLVRYKSDRFGLINCRIGSLYFTEEEFISNFNTFFLDLKKKKPSNSKGVYIRSVCLSSCMGPGLKIDLQSIGI